MVAGKLKRLYPNFLELRELRRNLDRFAAVNVVDKETEGEVGGQTGIHESHTREFPAGEIQDEKHTGPEFDQFKRPRQAEIGQELTQLTTEREKSKVKQKDTQHGLWDESYSDDNSFEDADLKLGENQNDDDVDPLEQPTYEPHAQGTGPLDSRYEDAGKKYDIVLHSSRVAQEDIDPNKGPRQIWIAVDLDGTILEPPPGDVYEKDGKHLFGAPKPGAREAMYEMIDGGARVSVYTARTYFAKTKEQEDSLLFDVENVLVENDIPFTDVYIGNKPPAHMYIDDRNIPFDDDWDFVLDTVRDRLKKKAQTEYDLDEIVDNVIRNMYEDERWGTDDIITYLEGYDLEGSEFEYAYNSILEELKQGGYLITAQKKRVEFEGFDPETIQEMEPKIDAALDELEAMACEELDFPSPIIPMTEDDISAGETVGAGHGLFQRPDTIKINKDMSSDAILANMIHEYLHWIFPAEDEDSIDNRTDIILRKLEMYVHTPPVERGKTANDPVKDTVNFQGIDIDVEWPNGSIRSYEGADTYVTHMKADYGYARGVEGNDGEELDIYLADRESASPVAFIIEQLTEEGEYDEDKIVLGVESEGEAADIYLKHMPSYMLGDIREVPVERLRNALYGEPEDRRGQEDQVPSEEKEAMILKVAGYSEIAMEAIEKANITPLAKLILQHVDLDAEYVTMIDQLVRAMLRDKNLKAQVEQLLGRRPELGYPEYDPGQIEETLGEETIKTISYRVATKSWPPEDDIFENEFTDGTEDRENRDIPRPEEKEKATYRNALKENGSCD